jgi:hypothetical protein
VADPLAIYERVRPNLSHRSMYGERGTGPISAMFSTLRAQFEPAAIVAALSFLAEPGAMQKLQPNEEHPAARFLLASPRSPLFAADKPRLMEALESKRGCLRVVEDAGDYLEILLSALEHRDSRICSADERRAFIVAHHDLIALLWELSVSEPSQFRMLQSLRERRLKLLESGVPLDSIPNPTWLTDSLERPEIGR